MLIVGEDMITKIEKNGWTFKERGGHLKQKSQKQRTPPNAAVWLLIREVFSLIFQTDIFRVGPGFQ